MPLQPSIILAGQQPDFLGTIDQANRAAAFETQTTRQNKLAQLYQQQGAGLLSGDEGAVNALAGLDPQAAMGIQQTHRDNQVQEQEIGRRNMVQDRDFNLRIQDYKRKVGVEEAAKHAESVRRAVTVASGAQTPEDWDRIATQFGEPDLVGQFDRKDEILREFMTLAEALAADAPPAPLSGPGKVQADIAAGILPQNTPLDGPPDGAAEQAVARIMETGVDRATAIKIKDGVYKVLTDPTTRESVIVDLATQQIVSGFGTAPEPAGAPAPEVQRTQVAPADDTALSYGQRFQGADSSFGLEGFGRGMINKGADILGADMPYPETSGAQRDFAVMREDMTSKIQNAYDGRVPAFLLKGIQDLTPQAGSIFEGAGEAQSKLRALGRNLHKELENVKDGQERRLSPADAEALAKRRQVLESSLSQVSEALKGFAPAEGQTTVTGTKWRIVDE